MPFGNVFVAVMKSKEGTAFAKDIYVDFLCL